MSNTKNYIAYIFAFILICILVWLIVNQVKEHHLQDDPMLHTLREILKPVHPIFEKIQLYKGDKSYTINKEKTFLCLYDENGEYYNLQMILTVLLHECAHILNRENIGHTPEFYDQLDKLVKRATELGIYDPNIPPLQDYCNY